MKTAQSTVTSLGAGMEEALRATERLGESSGLSRKANLRLRLLSEELLGMMRSIMGEVSAQYWAEQDARRYDIHLDAEVTLNQEMRRQLIAVSSRGENAAARGFMGKLRDMIAVALLPKEAGPSMLSLGLMSLGSPGGYRSVTDSFDWSMTAYRSELEGSRERDGEAADAWDELEKSIVANLADEVSVNIVGSAVEIVITKAFPSGSGSASGE